MSKFLKYISSICSILIFQSNFLFAQFNDFDFGNFFTGSKEFIEISYGLGNLQHKNINTNFNSLSQNEIILGRRFIKPIFSANLISFSDNYLFSSYVNDYGNNDTENSKISFDIWRFGLGYRKGFGYRFGSISIMPYNHMGFSWSKSNFSISASPLLIPDNIDLKKLDFFDNAIKFGTSNIGGIDIRLSKMFGIGASYEAAVIFPYHKFWKQFGGFFIETLSQTGIDYLTEGVLIKAIPSLTPVLYFLMKNGLSYYLYTLKQDDMNWPFKTTAPLTLEAFKFSLKISF